MDTTNSANHQIILQNRYELEVSDVKAVDTYDDSVVIAVTSLGVLSIRGNQLQIKRLDLDSGNLSIGGKIESIIYSEPSKGLLSRIFR